MFKVRHPFINKLESSKFFVRLQLDIFLKRIEPESDYPIHHYYMLTIQGGHHFIFNLTLVENPEKKYDIWFLRILFFELMSFDYLVCHSLVRYLNIILVMICPSLK